LKPAEAKAPRRPPARGTGTAPAPAAEPRPERRLDWHAYFMNIARQVATRSTCDRKHVGAVIVRDKTILSTGYNGSIRGMPHCDDIGHDIEGGHCVATIHAEANAILQAAKNGVMIEGAELYTTASPCWGCFKLIANAGIRKIFYGEFYRDQKSLEVARRLGIDLIDLAPAGPAGAAKTGAGPAERSGGTGRARGGCDWQGPED